MGMGNKQEILHLLTMLSLQTSLLLKALQQEFIILLEEKEYRLMN